MRRLAVVAAALLTLAACNSDSPAPAPAPPEVAAAECKAPYELVRSPAPVLQALVDDGLRYRLADCANCEVRFACMASAGDALRWTVFRKRRGEPLLPTTDEVDKRLGLARGELDESGALVRISLSADAYTSSLAIRRTPTELELSRPGDVVVYSHAGQWFGEASYRSTPTTSQPLQLTSARIGARGELLYEIIWRDGQGAFRRSDGAANATLERVGSWQELEQGVEVPLPPATRPRPPAQASALDNAPGGCPETTICQCPVGPAGSFLECNRSHHRVHCLQCDEQGRPTLAESRHLRLPRRDLLRFEYTGKVLTRVAREPAGHGIVDREVLFELDSAKHGLATRAKLMQAGKAQAELHYAYREGRVHSVETFASDSKSARPLSRHTLDDNGYTLVMERFRRSGELELWDRRERDASGRVLLWEQRRGSRPQPGTRVRYEHDRHGARIRTINLLHPDQTTSAKTEYNEAGQLVGFKTFDAKDQLSRTCVLSPPCDPPFEDLSIACPGDRTCSNSD